ncbi:MAG: acetylglutamate kinase [Verrucomicrobiota bacterium]
MNSTEKAEVLLEALPYMQGFRGETFLIKVGGSAMEDPSLVDRLMRDVVLLEAVGINPVIVHGGGKAISRAMADAGLKADFVGGLRITDETAIAIVEQTLSREVNPALVRQLKDHGGKAVGISGRDVFVGEKVSGVGQQGETVDLGFVGRVTEVELDKVFAFVAYETVPVISPVASVAGSDSALNVNADLAASALAAAMKATKLVYLSDVRGVMRDPGEEASLIPTIADSEIEVLIAEGVITGGMIPKLRSASEALHAGVGKVHMIDGRIAHSLLLEIFTDIGIGTEIVP